MTNHTHLLSLPFELRDMIWAFCSDNTDSNGLLGCCHRTRDEFTPHCVLTDEVEKLQTLRILVDSTYDDGIWLKFDYTWEQDGYYHRAISQVGDMSDPIAQTLLKIREVDKIIVDLHAPRRGYFVGALFMMLAKTSDVYGMVARMLREFILERPNTNMGHVEINFSTETIQPGQTAKEAKNIWECRSPKALQEPIRKYWRNSGQMPYFYEYFLINHPCMFPRPPTINYLTGPRKHVHRKDPLDAETVQRYHEMRSNKLNGHKKIHQGRFDYQQQMAKYAAIFMTKSCFDFGRIRNVHGLEHSVEGHELLRDHWDHIFYDWQNLMSRFQFWLDNLPGPVGGHMDMLRLHRLKTMNNRDAGFFASQNQSFPRLGGPYGASTEINRRLSTLFDPFAAHRIIELRDSCPHFRVVDWAAAPLSEHGECNSNEAWLKFYPKGIRYYWNRRNLIEWRLHWRTEAYNWLDKIKYPRGHPYHNNVRLHQWWECVASYQDSGTILNDLAHPKEREALEWTLKYFTIHPPDNDRPVLVRRDRDESVVRCVRKGCGYTIYDYLSMGLRCWWWADMAGEETYCQGDEEGLPAIELQQDTVGCCRACKELSGLS